MKPVVAYIFSLLILFPVLAFGAEPQPLRSALGISKLLKSHEALINKHFAGYHDRLWIQHSEKGEALVAMVYFPGAGPNPLLFRFRGES